MARYNSAGLPLQAAVRRFLNQDRPCLAGPCRLLETRLVRRLDAIDLHILRELQEDGRMTNVELARRVGISAPPCLRRVRALEEAGYIRGYRDRKSVV